jgi:hypothetical protein
MSKQLDPAVWAKLQPASDRYGMSRPEIFRACVVGDIEAVHVKKAGRSRGIWLVNVASLEPFIRSFAPGGSRYGKEAGIPAAPVNRQARKAIAA